jgi:hypothetical protein
MLPGNGNGVGAQPEEAQRPAQPLLFLLLPLLLGELCLVLVCQRHAVECRPFIPLPHSELANYGPTSLLEPDLRTAYQHHRRCDPGSHWMRWMPSSATELVKKLTP